VKRTDRIMGCRDKGGKRNPWYLKLRALGHRGGEVMGSPFSLRCGEKAKVVKKEKKKKKKKNTLEMGEKKTVHLPLANGGKRIGKARGVGGNGIPSTLQPQTTTKRVSLPLHTGGVQERGGLGRDSSPFSFTKHLPPKTRKKVVSPYTKKVNGTQQQQEKTGGHLKKLLRPKHRGEGGKNKNETVKRK